MAKFQKTVNVWDQTLNVATLQPGQWVEAGEGGDRGVFCGLTNTNAVVVAWLRNAKAKRDGGYRGYIATLFNYAKTWSN